MKRIVVQKNNDLVLEIKVTKTEGGSSVPVNLAGKTIFFSVNTEAGAPLFQKTKSTYEPPDDPTNGIAYLAIEGSLLNKSGSFVYQMDLVDNSFTTIAKDLFIILD